MKQKVSVIVAAYNVGKYIEKCVRSLLAQSYRELEIIVVDDGSTDNTGAICDALASEDSRITVLHKENGGLSEARNDGIVQAHGEWISLIDGDDFVENEFIEKLLNAANGNKADVVVCGYNVLHGAKKFEDCLSTKQVLRGEDACCALLTKQRDLDVLAWNKLYRKSLFVEKSIRYPAGKIHEDNLTTYKLYAAANKVAFVDYAGYNYIKRKHSITSKSSDERRLKMKIEAANEAREYFAKNDRLRAAADFSLYLMYVIGANDALREKDVKTFAAYREKILRMDIGANCFVDKKAKLYLALLRPCSGLAYKLMRKLIGFAKSN